MWLTSDHFSVVFWIAVIPAFLSLGLILFAVREPARPQGLRRVRVPLHRSELGRLSATCWWVVAVAFVFTLARFSEAFLVLHAQSIGLSLMLVPIVLVIMNIGYSFSAFQSASCLTSLIGSHFSSSACFCCWLPISCWPSRPALSGLGSAWRSGLYMGFTQGLQATLVADAAPAELRGTAFGMFNLVTGLAMLIASVIAGALWDVAGPSGTFLAGAAFTVLTLAGLRSIHHRLRGGARD